MSSTRDRLCLRLPLLVFVFPLFVFPPKKLKALFPSSEELIKIDHISTDSIKSPPDFTSMPSLKRKISGLSPEDQTILIKSKEDLYNYLPHKDVVFSYKARPECAADYMTALAVLHEHNIAYVPKQTTDASLYIETKCTIEDLRKIWTDANKDLHYIVETLNYSENFNGRRWYTHSS